MTLLTISQIPRTFRSTNTFRSSHEIESEINNFLLTLEFKKEEINMLLKGFSEEEKKLYKAFLNSDFLNKASTTKDSEEPTKPVTFIFLRDAKNSAICPILGFC